MNQENRIIQRILNFVGDERNTGHIPQPMFVVGSSGAGKTTLMHLLRTRLNEEINIGSVQCFDGKRFFCSADIISVIEGENYDGSFRPEGDSDTKRRIVMIDDMDYFFNRSTFDDQYLLRNYLNHESSPLLIATISGVGKSLADYKAPFFEGVRLIYLPSIDKAALSSTGLSVETRRRLNSLMEYLPPVARSFKMALDVVATSECADNDLKELLDRFSQSYRFRLESLPVNSQKILYSIAQSNDPMTLTELRELTGLPSGILSTYLRQLAKSGEIRKTTADKRGAPYEIRDRLFKLWLSWNEV